MQMMHICVYICIYLFAVFRPPLQIPHSISAAILPSLQATLDFLVLSAYLVICKMNNSFRCGQTKLQQKYCDIKAQNWQLDTRALDGKNDYLLQNIIAKVCYYNNNMKGCIHLGFIVLMTSHICNSED